jgi:hypothetical protein
MWSLLSALEKVKLSASKASNVPTVLLFPRTVPLRDDLLDCQVLRSNALAPPGPGRVTAPASAQAPVASGFLRDIVLPVIVCSPFDFI